MARLDRRAARGSSAFALGAATNELGPAQRVNVLAFPLIALLAWNLAVYVFVVLRVLSGATLGGVRGWIARIAQGLPGAGRDGGTAAVLSAFTADWTTLSSRLTAARAARVLHVAAASFALGAIAGMYLRGLAFEYRAGWESTFLDAQQVHALLAFVLAPGAWATGIAVPDAAHLETIRFSATGGGETRRAVDPSVRGDDRVVAILPRLLLAALNGLFVQRRSARFPLSLRRCRTTRACCAATAATARVSRAALQLSAARGRRAGSHGADRPDVRRARRHRRSRRRPNTAARIASPRRDPRTW